MASNKIKYGLCNVHVAPLTENSDATFVYGAPVALPGAVNLSLESQGESEPFYADDNVYYRSVSNNGYSGDLELALVPDWFREMYLREIVDSNGVMVESAKITDPKYFAMLFEFSGDKHKVRHVVYKASISRPAVASQTKEASTTPVTETMTITVDPMANGLTRAKTGDDVDTTLYNNWFREVYIPTLTNDQLSGDAAAAVLTGLTISDVTLSPTFSAGTTSYSGEAGGETSSITATAASGTNISVIVNGASIASGGTVSWTTGANTVKITASKAGSSSTTYTVTVTKS